MKTCKAIRIKINYAHASHKYFAFVARSVWIHDVGGSKIIARIHECFFLSFFSSDVCQESLKLDAKQRVIDSS